MKIDIMPPTYRMCIKDSIGEGSILLTKDTEVLRGRNFNRKNCPSYNVTVLGQYRLSVVFYFKKKNVAKRVYGNILAAINKLEYNYDSSAS